MAGCPSFTVTVNEDLATALDRVKTKVEEAGGTFEGTTEGGSFSGSVPVVGSFKGEYTVSGNVITVTITEKPWNPFVTCSLIEEKIRDFFVA